MTRAKSLFPLTAALLTVAAGGLLVQAGNAAPRQPRIETGPDAEVTHDGLYRVQRSVMDAAWAKPGLDLTGYTGLMIVSGGIAFKKLPEVTGARARTATEFPVSEENKARLSEILREEFTEELEKLERYQIVTEPGPDVLLLVGYVIDVESHIPPDINTAQFGRGGVYLSSAGAATLVVELRDSQSMEVLARAADRRAAESDIGFEASDVTAWFEVRQLAKTWATLLRSRLEELEGV